MLIYPGRISLYGFLAPQMVSALFSKYFWGCDDFPSLLSGALISGYLITVLVIFKTLLKGYVLSVALRGFFLGCSFSFGVFITSSTSSSLQIFGWYLCFLSFFHWSEFMSIAWASPWSLNIDSYMLNHSKDYKLALVLSWVEFFLEYYFSPGLKSFRTVSIVGALLCIFGEIVRKSAIFTASNSFTHVVQWKKTEDHKLVTSGIYSFCRHPSYVGWFWWCLGTQLVLMNPICFVGYTLVAWKFFEERVRSEEVSLLNFYGQDYVEYQRRVGTGLPFNKGYLLE